MSGPAVLPAHLDDVARLLAEPSRLRMLWALGDGRAYTATELAGVAELAPSAASNHLARLVDAGVVEARSQGRHRYFALTREDVARAVESLGAVTLGSAPPPPARRQPGAALRHARRCYGHLAGACGVALWDRCCALRLIVADADGWRLSAAGAARFGRLGAEPERGAADRVQPCLDWTERRWHLGGALGRRLLAGLQADGVLAESPREGRTLLVHPTRWQRWLEGLDQGEPRVPRDRIARP
jgi:DNA-binding transcriptional ArsR family regulator